MLRQRFYRATVSLLVTLTVVMSMAPALASANTDRTLEQAAEPFSWWMESRYELGWRMYNKTTHTYPHEYVYPDGWAVGFDACESPLTEGMIAPIFSWSINGVDNDFSFEIGPLTDCRLTTETDPAAPMLPEQGEYDVTLLVESARSEPATASQTIEIRDLLIVTIGDSNASGEGNPHVNEVGPLRPVDGKWFEPRCHRSAHSGHARAAAAIEAADPHTAVTFLSFACSGGKIWEGLIDSYYGIQQPDSALTLPLDPQLLAIMEHLCNTNTADGDPTCIENPREIDSLFLSVGINDIGFSSILLSCAAEKKIEDINTEDLWLPGIVDIVTGLDWHQIRNRPADYLFGPLDELLVDSIDWAFELFGGDLGACEGKLEPVLDMNFATLWSHFDLLGEMLDGNAGQVASDIQSSQSSHGWMGDSLRTAFVNHYGDLPEAMTRSVAPDEVYITSYPGDPFRDGAGRPTGCGVFEGIEASNAKWLNQQGVRLNRHLEWEAEKNRWHFVDGILEGFDGHGYCAGGDRYYVWLVDSVLDQANVDGTIHPNSNGHNVTRDRLLETYNGDKQDFSEKHSATFDIEAVRVLDNDESFGSTTEFTAKIHDRWYRHDHMIEEIEVPYGEWFSLPEDSFQFHDELADNEIISVLAHTSAGGGFFQDPKCGNAPECREFIPPVKLKANRTFSLDNGWGADYEWCDSGPDENYYTSNRTCTIQTSTGGYTMEMRLKIRVVNVDASPAQGFYDPGDQVVCGEFCDAPSATSSSVPTPPALVEYVEYLESLDYDTSALMELVDLFEPRLAQ